jgi:trehalose 6-phosphate synthase
MGERSADGPVFIASNRGPVSFSLDNNGRLSTRRGGGGLVSGLSSVASHRNSLWVCAALSDADRAAARGAPHGRIGLDGEPDGSAVRLLDIPSATFQRAYNAVANSTLWFVHHMLYDRPNQPIFGMAFRREWESYRAYNRAFADALAQEAELARPETVKAMVQDYHLSLVPRMLSDLCPEVRIAHFSHTPWAPPEYYRMLPDEVGRAVLEGILGADHAGFLSQRWADAFCDCCEKFLGAEVDRQRKQVTYRGHATGIGVHALGVDAGALTSRASQPDVQARMTALAGSTGGRKLIVRIDRTELSKNIVRGLVAYRELLLAHPEWHGRVVHVAFAYPSRHDLPEYREYTAKVQRVASEIAEEFSTEDWDPLILQVDDDYARSLAAYRLADVLLVNPIRDGMNLVAKEGPILSDAGCALVLSWETGAAAELAADALMINPFDVSATADALHKALEMPDTERIRRAAALAEAGAALPPTEWFAEQLRALDQPPSRSER